MPVLRTILAKGHFAKELPPGFSTQDFARLIIKRNHGIPPLERRASSEPVEHRLHRPNGKNRILSLPNPFFYHALALQCSRHWKQLLTLAAKSPFTSSRPIYSETSNRPIAPNVQQTNLRERRVRSRTASRFTLIADIKTFYPSIYSHAIAWAISPTSRKDWSNGNLMGNKIDKAVRDMQGKRSIGIPIGPDLSLLLAECILARVDINLDYRSDRCYRWFDDYEISTNTLEEAEHIEARLARELKAFRLSLSDEKTRILELPTLSQPFWKQVLNQHDTKATANSIIDLFDLAYTLRSDFPDDSVLSYAIAKLFDVKRYSKHSALIENLVCQAMIAEPGCVQKAVALFVHYSLNNVSLHLDTIRDSIEMLVERSQLRDVGSDIAWCLHASRVLGIKLPASTGKIVSRIDDDVVAILAMHLDSLGLLDGWSNSRWAKLVVEDAVWGPHWLAIYEGVLRGWLPDPSGFVASDPHFGALLREDVHFYLDDVPHWTTVVHESGAPRWLAKQIIEETVTKAKQAKSGSQSAKPVSSKSSPRTASAESSLILKSIERRLNKVELSVEQLHALLSEATSTSFENLEEDVREYVSY